MNLKATIFKLMHKIRAIYLAIKIRRDMTLTFKVTLSKKVEFSNLAEKLKYSKFEQDSFNIKDLKGQNIIFCLPEGYRPPSRL